MCVHRPPTLRQVDLPVFLNCPIEATASCEPGFVCRVRPPRPGRLHNRQFLAARHEYIVRVDNPYKGSLQLRTHLPYTTAADSVQARSSCR